MEIRKIDHLSFEPFLQEAEIQVAIKELAEKISPEWKEKNPLILIVLQGAFVFAADLLRHFPFSVEIEFIRVKSYEGTESSGQIRSVMGLDVPVTDRNVLIIEDIVDTGKTAVYLRNLLKDKGAKSISMATFLYKPAANTSDFEPDYVGFSIEPTFVVGYGLDYEGKGRHWPGLWRLISNK
jgi:hypoxanthine phosphoribosyltransferase